MHLNYGARVPNHKGPKHGEGELEAFKQQISRICGKDILPGEADISGEKHHSS